MNVSILLAPGSELTVRMAAGDALLIPLLWLVSDRPDIGTRAEEFLWLIAGCLIIYGNVVQVSKSQ